MEGVGREVEVGRRKGKERGSSSKMVFRLEYLWV